MRIAAVAANDGIGAEKSIHQISLEAVAQQLTVNAIGPAPILRHFSALLPKSERSRMDAAT